MGKMSSYISNFKYMVKFVRLNITILLLFLILNFLVRISLNSQLANSFRNEFDTSILSDEPYDFLSIGTSHGVRSIDFNYYGVHGLNIAKAGQPFRYDLKKLHYYEKLYDNFTLLVIPVSFHSLCHDEENWLPHETIYNNQFPIVGMENILTLRAYFLETGYNLALMQSNDFNASFYGEISPTNCDSYLGISYLESILELHKNSVLITTPYLEEYLVSQNEFYEFYSEIYRITDEFNITYLDYSRDNRFQNRAYFMDATHLNSIGRRKFTKILLDDLQKVLNSVR